MIGPRNKFECPKCKDRAKRAKQTRKDKALKQKLDQLHG
jgi:hypothetical protein